MSENHSIFAALEITERGQRALDRIKEIFKLDAVPAGLRALAASDNGINDVYMNLNRQLADGKLSQKTKVLVAVGVAAAAGSPRAVDLFADIALAAGRTREEVLEAVSIATVCSIFNGYYRFRYQIPAELKPTYEAFKAPFNANSFMKSFVKKDEMESICVAVSSMNNCMGCVEGHLNAAKNAGLTDEQIDEVIRVGAVAFATAAAVGALTPTEAPVAG